MSKIKLEDIINELKDKDWVVLSEAYENLNSEMIFKCPEGHKVYTTWKKLRNKTECPVCKSNIYKDQNSNIVSKKKNDFRVLALDQATRITGYSIYDNNKLIKYGTFETELTDEIERDHALKVWLVNMINNWKPDLVGLEDIQLQNFGEKGKGKEFSNNNGVGIQTYKVLAHLQGILMETCFENRISYVICPPATWRAHCKVTGKTKSDKKRSMQIKVKELFDISVTNDEADAIGIGKYLSEKMGRTVQIVSWE